MAEIPLRRKYHSVTFAQVNSEGQIVASKNTWDDWHLVPTSRPVVPPPKVKTVTVDVPGRDGVLDLSEVVAGRPVYGNRSGSIEFHVETDFTPGGSHFPNQENWQHTYSTIMQFIHGKWLRMILDDDPDFYYEGRMEINNWKSDKQYSLIMINYDVGPFRKKISDNSDGGL